ncbi:hypothetical protein [Nitrosovibrio sp. Nv4]|uniref:hypothetical protein n=1 Tax=Nitrosovibrio sp. Nv4 TaxID=1945880 RepID=UPI000BE2C77C|nr:hypothetical protein [Nitrosovibrio sp. Nv4]
MTVGRIPRTGSPECRRGYRRLCATKQIEEACRDLKSEFFGLGFNSNRSTGKDRLTVLLLIACLASFVLCVIGEAGKARKLHLQF